MERWRHQPPVDLTASRHRGTTAFPGLDVRNLCRQALAMIAGRSGLPGQSAGKSGGLTAAVVLTLFYGLAAWFLAPSVHEARAHGKGWAIAPVRSTWPRQDLAGAGGGFRILARRMLSSQRRRIEGRRGPVRAFKPSTLALASPTTPRSPPGQQGATRPGHLVGGLSNHR